MSGEVVLSAALRNNLASLQKTQFQIDRAQNILSTGLRVASALDDPQNFFASQALKQRSSDLNRLLDGIGQSVQTLKAADNGVTNVTKLVEQAQSIVDAARDAITNGDKEASVTGSIDLSGITSNGATGGLTSVTGIADNAEIAFTVKDKDGNIVTLSDNQSVGAGAVQINTGDSIDQLIANINDLVNSTTGEAVLRAELTTTGKLKISALDGGSFNMKFDYDGDGAAETAAADITNDLSLASALGFGNLAQQTAAGGATSGAQASEVSVTALNNTKLVSGVFYKNGDTGFADASDLLTNVDDTDVGGTKRFSAGATADLRLTINGTKTSGAINITGTSIQGLVDGINNDSTIGNLVQATYDNATGQFTIEAKNASVETIKVELVGAAGEALPKADFDFGYKTSLASAGTATNVAETFVMASAASTLSQLEDDYDSIREQINQLVEDSGYRGVNLIARDTLDTYFNEDRTNKLSTTGRSLNADGMGLVTADFSRLETIETAADSSRAALTQLRSFGSTLATSLSVIQTRESFTKSMVETLDGGSDKLIVADQNEEGAKLLALQTRQQLGITALSLASQAQQAVLRLF